MTDEELLAINDYSGLVALADERAKQRLTAIYTAVTVAVIGAIAAGPAYGVALGGERLAHMILTVALGGVFAPMLLGLLMAVAMVFSSDPGHLPSSVSHRRKLEQQAWRPRAGARHPDGRTDTQDRYIIERLPHSDGVQVALLRYSFDTETRRWRAGEPVGAPRVFAPDEEDELDAHLAMLRGQLPAREVRAVEEHAERTLRAERIADLQRHAVGTEVLI